MRKLDGAVSTVVLAGLIVSLGAVAPATGVTPGFAASAAARDVPPEVPWTPPADADDTVPPESNPPEEVWAPREETRLDAAPDAGARGVAPLGAPVGTVAGKPGLGELPWFAFEDFQLWEHSTLHVNIANGNLLVKANDSKIAVPGYGLRQDRYYNGLSTNPGSLGGGWQQNNGTYDIGVQDAGSYVDYFAFNGAKFRFTSTGGSSYSAPAGSNLSLTKDTASGTYRYIVTVNKTGEQLKFSTTGWLTATLDRNGVGETYAYNAGDVASVYHANGRGYTFSYNADFRVKSVTDTAGRQVTYDYDSSYRLSQVQDAKNARTFYEYDSTGRLSKITVPAGDGVTATLVTTIEYDTSHRVKKIIQQKSSSATVETVFTYNSGQTLIADENGNTATYTIDSEGRVSAAKDALNRTRAQSWTANSDVATTTDGIGSNVTTYTYDGNNNQTNAQLPTGAAASAAYATGTGCTAPNTGTAFQPKCSTDPAGNSSQYQYDAAGNLTKQTNTTGGGSSTEFEKTYDNSSRTVCGGYAGQVCSTKDANGKTTTYAYNIKGDLTTVTPPAPMGATTYTHDSLGRVVTVTDGNGKTTTYEYEVRDRIIDISHPNTSRVSTTYWTNGLERQRTDGAGPAAITFTYDRLGRLTQQQYSNPSITQKYTYDNVGNMLTYEDGAGIVTYTYDVANQLKTLREPGGTCPGSGNPSANSGCLLFEYDNNGNETKRTYPGGAVTTTTRDNSGRATRITAKDSAGTVAVDVGYNYKFPGTNVDQSNLQSRTAHKEQGITAGAVTAYSYDSRNRLTKAEEKSGATVSASWTYGYDATGNRTSQIRSGSTGATAGTINYTYNDANQLTSATGQTTTWTYDGAGNQTRNGLTGQTAAYNDRLQATTIGGTGQTYIGEGNNDRRGSGTVTFQNGALGTMQRTSGTATHFYTRTPDGSGIGYRASAKHYYITDHLGSVVGSFSATGAYEGGYSYAPYGEARSTSTATAITANNLRYTGQHHDGNGIYKLGVRYYDTSLGRFTQPDPTGQEANQYTYAALNPANNIDPSGTSWLAATRIVQVLFGGLGVYGALTGSNLAGFAAGFVAEVACWAITGGVTLATSGAGFFTALACVGLGAAVGAGVEWTMSN